jgi:nucleoside 2-deoxyribosyltransferase
MAEKKRVYLASPLGFAASTRAFMAETIARLSGVVTVINPWDDTSFAADFERAHALTDINQRRNAFHEINLGIGAKNERMIRSVEMLVAVLDGVDVDSGTAGEMGFAYGLGLPVYGLRTDFRVTGDNEAAGINLQLRYFIEQSGGAYFTTVDTLVDALRRGA